MDDVFDNLFLALVKEEWSSSVHIIFSVETLPATHFSRVERISLLQLSITLHMLQ